MTDTPTVLFLCIHNSGRDLAARVLLDHYGQGRGRVESAGSEPGDDTCPVYPGKRYLDWDPVDPAGKPVDEVLPIVDDIDHRVRDLLTDVLGS